MEQYNILIVEDDKEIRDGIEIFLKSQNYNVFKAADGVEGLEVMEREKISLAIVDIMMPRMDGVTMTMKLREKYDFPVIMLSAKSEETDKVIGLNIGADDYVTKPFTPLELMARVNSQLRRYTQFANRSPKEEKNDRIHVIGGLELNEDTVEVFVDGKPVKMTPIEFKILALLIRTPGRVYSADEIYERVWNEKAINTGTVISTLFACVVAGGSYFLGGFGRLFDGKAIYDETGNVVFDRIIPHMLSSLPDILIGIVVVLVLSASMSTLASLVLTSSSTLTLDFLKDNVMKDMSEKKQVRTMQVLIVFFIVVSVVIALDPPTFIAQLMGISWGALAGAFLAPFLYGLYWRGVTKAAVWASFIAGVGITVSNMFFHYIASPINAGAIAMIAGLVVVPVVSVVTPKLKKERVEDIFSCYEEKVTITKKRSLEAN